MDGAVDLNIPAIKIVMDMYNIKKEDQKNILLQILSTWRTMYESAKEKSK